MAGAGRKDWTAGAQVAAADMDTYLMEQTVMQFATSAARDTALASILDEGLLTTQADSNSLTAYSGSAWSTTGPLWGALTSYTSAISGTGWAIGNGTLSAQYARQGRLVYFQVSVTFGGTTTFGAGQLAIALPFTSSANNAHFLAILGDTGTATYIGYGGVSGANALIYAENAAGTYASIAAVTSTVPHTWASTDTVTVAGVYEASTDA